MKTRGIYFNQDGGNAGGAGTGTTAAAGTPPAGGTSQPPAAGAGAAGGATPPPAAPAAGDWRSGMPDDVKGYAELKGWKDPGSVVESYKNLEKMHGVPPEQLLKLPKDATDKAAMDAVYERLGRPKTPNEYRIEAPKEGGNPQLAEWAKGTFHKLGLTATQAETLYAEWNGMNTQAAQAAAQAQATRAAQEESALKREWGAAHEQNISIAKRGAAKFGLDGEAIDKLQNSMGYAQTMKFLQKIGEGTGEGRFVEGQGTGGPRVLSPLAAQAKIRELQSDKIWGERYIKGDKDARAEMNQLIEWAAQG